MRWARVLAVVLSLTLISATTAYGRGGHGTGRRSYSGGSVHVRGYTKKNGTYVAPHHRTRPNRTKVDNWSTKGNVNPYTGKEGTKDP